MNKGDENVMKVDFLKVVCVDESNPFGYEVLEDSNQKDLESVHEFVLENFSKHEGAKWLLYPCSLAVKE